MNEQTTAGRRHTLELLLREGPPALLVSLPRNDLTLARAALDGGAEGLKAHINIEHAAAGIKFGTLAQEAAALERIVALGLPVGIVPGDAQAMASPEDLRRLAEMGIDFLDAYLEAMPAWTVASPSGSRTGGSPARAGEPPALLNPLPVMAALGPGDVRHPHRLAALAALAPVRMVEASIIPHEGYGQPLSVGDLCDYTAVVAAMRAKPVIVPTQRRILPEDVPALAATGIRGLLIGAIVTGTEPHGLQVATRRYRDALEVALW